MSTRSTVFYLRWGALGAVMAIYAVLLILLGVRFEPNNEDETPYYNSAQMFAEHNSLQTSFCIEEKVAKLTGGDWYGPGYPLFYGLFVKITGGHVQTFIYVNVALLLLFVFLIFRSPLTSGEKFWLATLSCMTAPLLLYSFYFFPTLADVAMGTGLFVLLLRALRSGEKKYILLFFLLAVVFALVKQNIAFFAFGSLALSRNWKQGILYLAASGAVMLIAMAAAGQLAAPAYAKSLEPISALMRFDFAGFFEGVKYNVWRNYWPPIYLNKSEPAMILPYMLLFPVPVLHLFMSWRTRSRELWAVTLILCISMGFFFLFYKTEWYYLMRISAPVLVLSLAGFLFYPGYFGGAARIAVAVVVAATLPLSMMITVQHIGLKKDAAANVQKQKEVFAPLQQLVTGEGKTLTVLYDGNMIKNFDETDLITSLPVVNASGQFIRYTVNLTTDTWKLHGRLPVHYLLSHGPVEVPGSRLVEANDNWHLYAVNP